MRVHLVYFKPSGKMYSSEDYKTSIPDQDLVHPKGARAPALFQIWDEVAELKNARRLPGLIEGHSNFSVLIDVPDHPHRHPHLLFGGVDVA